MKTAIIFCFLSFSFSAARSQALIRGRIKDSNHAKVTVFAPINGVCNRIVSQPVALSRSGEEESFECHIGVDFPAMVTITIGLRPVWLLVEPGDTVPVDLDADRFGLKSPGGGMVIGGKNGAGNSFYNIFNYSPAAKFNRFQHLLDSMNFRETLDPRAVDEALSVITHPFDSLLTVGKITHSFYDVVVNDTRNVLISHLLRFAFEEKKFTTGQARTFFDRIYSRYPLTEAAVRGGLYEGGACFEYYFTKARRAFPDNETADSIIRINGKAVFVNKNLVPFLYVPASLRQPFWAFELITLKRLFASQFGVRDVDAFLAIFPESKMRPYLAPPWFNLSDGPTTFGDSSGFVFYGAGNAHSFDTLLAGFRGRKWLVDLWATSCIPCKMEFGFNAPIDSFCRRHDIGRLYVAFEKGRTRDNVKKDVYAYDLKGFHVIANDTLINDMTRRIYPPNEGYVIPHYLLIDENGDIVDKDAPRPSSANELMARMATVFRLHN